VTGFALFAPVFALFAPPFAPFAPLALRLAPFALFAPEGKRQALALL
jgi:hypothetical protein